MFNSVSTLLRKWHGQGSISRHRSVLTAYALIGLLSRRVGDGLVYGSVLKRESVR